MEWERGRILAVDDSVVNRRLLTRVLAEQGYTITTAEDGRQALARLHECANAFDVVLLDIVMPELDGYETLRRIKQDEDLQHLPVIMISGVDELDSVIRCIELGATDYLPKPFNAALLKARLEASLAAKRLRDMEREYLEQVTAVTNAAVAMEEDRFQTAELDRVAARPDALGALARVFQHMAREVYAREQLLREQVESLRFEIDQQRQANEIAEITETDLFREIQTRARERRQRQQGSSS